jgi:hypothetical protein
VSSSEEPKPDHRSRDYLATAVGSVLGGNIGAAIALLYGLPYRFYRLHNQILGGLQDRLVIYGPPILGVAAGSLILLIMLRAPRPTRTAVFAGAFVGAYLMLTPGFTGRAAAAVSQLLWTVVLVGGSILGRYAAVMAPPLAGHQRRAATVY